LAAQRTLAKLAQILQGIQARIVSVVPHNLISVIADGRNLHRCERGSGGQFLIREDSKRVGRLAEFSFAAGARTVIAKVLPRVNALVPVAPSDYQLIFPKLA
jgi:hypothetical protein